jgi:hypothetical protein
MNLKEAIQDINNLFMKGGWEEAFAKYYAEDVVTLEGAQVVARSRSENIAREKDFLSGVTRWNRADVLHVAVGENVTMTEWTLDFEHASYGHKKGNQVAVQEWRDGKVIREQYYSLY